MLVVTIQRVHFEIYGKNVVGTLKILGIISKTLANDTQVFSVLSCYINLLS